MLADYQALHLLQFFENNGLNWDTASMCFLVSTSKVQEMFYSMINLPVEFARTKAKQRKKKGKLTNLAEKEIFEEHQCLICLNYFDSFQKLQRHRSLIHKNKNFKPKCSFCAKRISKKNHHRHEIRCLLRKNNHC